MQFLHYGRVWLGLALAIALSLVAGSAFAHDGRVVGQYRFVVGFSEEPAYEGMINAVSVRITKSSDAPEGSTGVTIWDPPQARWSPPNKDTTRDQAWAM